MTLRRRKANELQYSITMTGLTFAKSGGGFLPLHRLDRAHTAFRVVVRRLDLASSLHRAEPAVSTALTQSDKRRQTTNTYCCKDGRMPQLST